MATSIFFNGRTISVPGSYSEVDASGLEQVGLGATGIVAVLGTAEGGRPVSDITETKDFIRIKKPESARTQFRSGNLREVADMLFAPAKDPNILGGAVEVVAMKVNPATQSVGVLANAYGDCMDLTSVDYGAFTSQVNVSIGDGTSQGKLVTITFEDVVESVDDLGGDSIFKVKYVKPTGGWDTMTANIEAGGHLVCAGTRDVGGLDGQITAQPSGASVMSVASSDSGDTTQQITIYGLDDTNAAVKETLNLTGDTPVVGTQVFSKVLGARLSAAAVGTITVSDDDPATILTIAPAALTAGLAVCSTMYAAGTIDVVADAATTKNLLLVGYGSTGAVQLEKLTLNGTTPVNGAGVFSELTYLAMGEVEAARTVTFSGEAIRTNASTQNTIQKVADYVNARAVGTDGFILTVVTGMTTFDPDDLDVTNGAGGAVSCLSPAEPDFYADLWAVINWMNLNSQFVNSERASGAVGGAPNNTTAPLFLAGGAEGTVVSQNWQDALNLLKKVRVNSIVALSPDPAVHAMVDAHCAYMCGIGRSERDGFVGLMNAGMTDVASKTEVKSQIVDLNSRHIRAFAQAVERYNTAGEREEFAPYFQAAIAAGMQAGSPVGESLTFKYANVLGLRQKSGTGSWNPTDDAEEMIQAGLCFMESVEGVGRRVVRNITTHLSSNNIAYIEGSVNEAVNFAVFNFRTNLEFAVGKKGFSGTINAGKGVAINTLGLLKDAQVIVASRSLDVELIVDVLEVSVEMAPVIPINFIKNTVHLVTIRQTAE